MKTVKLFVIIIVAVLGLSLVAAQEGSEQTSMDLAAAAEEALEADNSELALLLSLEALESYPYMAEIENILAHSVHEMDTGKIVEIDMRKIRSNMVDAVWSPDGSLMATTSFDRTVRVWDMETGELVASVDEAIGLLGWSPDSTRIAVDEVVVDANTGEILLDLPNAAANPLGLQSAWSADGTLIATNFDVVQIWDAETGEEVARFSNGCGYLPAAWSSIEGDNRLLTGCAITGEENGDWIWEETDSGWESTVNFTGYEGGTPRPDWSPDATRIISGASSGTVHVWDAETGEEIIVLEGHRLQVWDAEFSPDGTRAISGGAGGQVHIWDVETGGCLFVQCSRNGLQC